MKEVSSNLDHHVMHTPTLYIRLFCTPPGGFLFIRLENACAVTRAFVASLSAFFFAPPTPIPLTPALVTLFVMQSEHLPVLFSLSPPVPSAFAAPFSPLHLSFAALFQLLYHERNCGQLVLLKMEITVDHHLLRLVNSAFYSCFAFFLAAFRASISPLFSNSKQWAMAANCSIPLNIAWM